MKNKFFACFKLIPISIFCFVVCVSAFLIGIGVDGLPEPAYMLVISIILLIALPAVLGTIFIIVGCIMIEVTKEGISTVLFGKRLKFFKWEEISKVEITQPSNRDANQQISFSRDRNTNSGKKKTEQISFTVYALDLSRMAILKHYAPEYIIEKLNNSANQ